MVGKASIALVVIFLLLPGLIGNVEAQEKAAQKSAIRVDEEFLSVKLNKAPADRTFRTIADKANIVVRLDETLFQVPLTDEFDKLPLDEGLRRLIGKFQIQNFAMGFLEDQTGRRRVVSVDILAPGSGIFQEFGKNPAAGPKMGKGVQIQKARTMDPGQRKKYEKTGALPAHIPEGIQLRKERGDKLPGGWSWKYEEYNINGEAMGTPPGQSP